MITVPTLLLDLDLMVYVLAAVGAMAVIVATLAVRQGRWQRDADTDPPGFTNDPGD